MVARILSDTFRREKVFSHCDASDVLREAFSQTEAHMDHLYEVFSLFSVISYRKLQILFFFFFPFLYTSVLFVHSCLSFLYHVEHPFFTFLVYALCLLDGVS